MLEAEERISAASRFEGVEPIQWRLATTALSCACEAIESGATDIHFIVGNPMGIRIGGTLLPRKDWGTDIRQEWIDAAKELCAAFRIADPNLVISGKLAAAPGEYRLLDRKTNLLVAFLLLARSSKSSDESIRVLAERCFLRLGTRGAFDWTSEFGGPSDLRVRVAAQSSRGGVALALRRLDRRLRPLDELGFSRDVLARLKTVSRRTSGLVLCVGSVNSGKSSTMNAMVAYANREEPRKVVSNEDPVEMLHGIFGEQCAALTQHREIGQDITDFTSGLHQALRGDAECVLVGEIRDKDAMTAAMHACQAGHLVYASMHAGSFLDALDIIARFFPREQREAGLLSFARNLAALIFQTLQPTSGITQQGLKARDQAAGRVVAHEEWQEGAPAAPVKSLRLVYEYVEGTPGLRQLLRNYAVAGPSFRLASFLDELAKPPHVPFPVSLEAARQDINPDTVARAFAEYEATLPGEALRK